MKKATLIIVVFTLLFFVFTNSFAQTGGSTTKSAMALFSDIGFRAADGQVIITLYSDNYVGYHVFYLPDPDRIVIDLPNNKVTVKGPPIININSTAVKRIRFSQFTTDSARIVLDTNGKQQYSIEENSKSLALILGKQSESSTAESSSASNSAVSVSAAPKATASSRGDVERPAGTINEISYSPSSVGEKISISGGGHEGYSIMRLTDPDRLVVSIPNCVVPDGLQFINIGSELVNDIRYIQRDANTANLIVDTAGQPQFHFDVQENQLVLVLEKPAYKNITYNNNGNRVFFSLKSSTLTETVAATNGAAGGSADGTSAEAAGLKKLYSGVYDETGLRYTISFPSKLADIGSGTMHINDGLLYSIEISQNTDTQTSFITFYGKTNLEYQIITNPDNKDTEITILKPFPKTDKLVVIDAGHGGSDSGATYEGIQEKDLNLKIALKLNDILKSKGVNTYMTRDDDTFIPLHDRADIANNLNAALFVSIHNNAYYASDSGTETLYYPSDGSKAFANIVQDTLVNALGTKNRGIVERPNLVVLNSTKMPSVIAEVAFITNTGDRAKLKDDNFLQKAAEALGDAIIKALKSLN